MALSFRGGVFGHVSEPEPARPISGKDPIDKIVISTFICQPVAEGTGPRDSSDFVLDHGGHDEFSVDDHLVLIQELGLDLSPPVGATGSAMNQANWAP